MSISEYFLLRKQGCPNFLRWTQLISHCMVFRNFCVTSTAQSCLFFLSVVKFNVIDWFVRKSESMLVDFTKSLKRFIIFFKKFANKRIESGQTKTYWTKWNISYVTSHILNYLNTFDSLLKNYLIVNHRNQGYIKIDSHGIDVDKTTEDHKKQYVSFRYSNDPSSAILFLFYPMWIWQIVFLLISTLLVRSMNHPKM